MHIRKFFSTKTFKIAPTCFDPKIIFRELHCSSTLRNATCNDKDEMNYLSFHSGHSNVLWMNLIF